MNILAIDTALEYLGICLRKDNEVLANYYSLCKQRNAKIIFNVLDELFQNTGMSMDMMDFLVATQGPGSYTGLRIGMSVAKTLGMVIKKPVIAVNTMELLASLVKPLSKDFWVLLNCTRNEVFFTKFEFEDETIKQKTPIHMTTIDLLLPQIKNKPVFLKRIPSMQKKINPLFSQIITIPLIKTVPDSLQLSLLGEKIFLEKEGDSFPTVQPLYIKKDVSK